MRHLGMCYYLHIPLVNLNVENKTTYKALVKSSLQMEEGKEKNEGSKAATGRERRGGLWGLIHYIL